MPTRLNEEQARAALDRARGEDDATWKQYAESLIVDLYARVDALESALRRLAVRLKQNGVLEPPAPAATDVQGAPSPNGTRMGADGSPITDPQQLEAEAMMDAVAGPRAGDSPLPQNGGRRTPPRGGVRVGADGTPITDPQQLAAEEAMDAAAGPAA